MWQHIFWFYSHPAVYVMILPAMGAISEVIPTFARRTIFGYRFIAFSSMAIAGIGGLVWAHPCATPQPVRCCPGPQRQCSGGHCCRHSRLRYRPRDRLCQRHAHGEPGPGVGAHGRERPLHELGRDDQLRRDPYDAPGPRGGTYLFASVGAGMNVNALAYRSP